MSIERELKALEHALAGMPEADQSAPNARYLTAMRRRAEAILARAGDGRVAPEVALTGVFGSGASPDDAAKALRRDPGLSVENPEVRRALQAYVAAKLAVVNPQALDTERA